MLFDQFDQYKSFDQTGQMVKLVWSIGQTGLVSPTLYAIYNTVIWHIQRPNELLFANLYYTPKKHIL